jgi:hypothetical protein
MAVGCPPGGFARLIAFWLEIEWDLVIKWGSRLPPPDEWL